MKPIAPRARIAESATLRINAKAKKIAAGLQPGEPRVLRLSVGEPDYSPPPVVAQKACDHIQRAGGRLTYTPAAGIPELRQAVARKVEERSGLRYDPDREILISVGGKHGLAGTMLATAPPGSRVLIPAPYWLSYPAMAVIAGAEPVILDGLRTGMKLTPEKLRSAADPRNSVLILNSPNNPSGMVYDRAELTALCQEAIRQDLWVISDEIYDRLIYQGGEHISVPTLEGMRERTILVNGVSKTYSMTGWRIGFVLGPEPVIQAMKTLQSHMTSNPCSAAQQAALAALQVSEEELTRHLSGPMEALHRRRSLGLELLGRIPGLEAVPPGGAFYIMVDVRSALGRPLGSSARVATDDVEFAELLLEEEHIAVAPGTPFGAPGFIRISFAVADQDLKEGLDRLQALLAG